MAESVAERERAVASRQRGGGVQQATLLLAPSVIAFGQQQLGYALVTWACARHAPALAHVPTILALLLLGVVMLGSRRLLSETGARTPGDERSDDARARFMAVSSLVMCAFSFVLIVAQWLPAAILHPCQR